MDQFHSTDTFMAQADWAETPVKRVTEDEDKATGIDKYQAGKVFAEKLVLDYPKRHPELKWDVVALLPPYVSIYRTITSIIC